MPQMPVKTVIDEKTGLHYRPEWKELKIIREQSQYSKLDFAGRVVMDCGANIGSFANKAIANGAVEVHCYEPHPTTFAVLKKNKKPEMQVHNRALLSKAEVVNFSVSPKYPSSNSVFLGKKKWGTIQVQAISFWDEVQRIKPSCVKFDIEGAEYDILTKPLPTFVEEFAIEFHDMMNPETSAKAKKILQMFSLWQVQKKCIFSWYITTAVLSRTRPGLCTVKEMLKAADEKWKAKNAYNS